MYTLISKGFELSSAEIYFSAVLLAKMNQIGSVGYSVFRMNGRPCSNNKSKHLNRIQK